MINNWGKLVSNDPYYNPNLSLTDGFAIDTGRGQRWPWNL